jgi:hypothetical protein
MKAAKPEVASRRTAGVAYHLADRPAQRDATRAPVQEAA